MGETIEFDVDRLAVAYIAAVAVYLLWRHVETQERQARAQERTARDVEYLRRESVGTLTEIHARGRSPPHSSTLDLDDPADGEEDDDE